MSLLALLATQGGSGVGPAPAPDPRPEPLDEVIAQIRPDGRRIWTATVAQDGTGDYTDLHAAEDAAWAAWRAKLADEGLREDQATPNHRCQVIVEPGTYEVSNLRFPPWAELIGRDRDQVTLTMPAEPQDLQGYVLSLGSRFYCESVTIIKPEGTGRYAVHNASGGTTIWANVGVFWEADEPWPYINGRPSGLDAGDGITVLWYRCKTNGRLDSHGWDANTVPSTHLFIEQEGGQVGYRSGDGGGGLTADQVWLVGGDVQAVAVAGPNSVFHRDPSAIVRGEPLGSSHNPGSTTERADWPIPYGGMSAQDRAHYGM